MLSQLARLLRAHTIVLTEARTFARLAAERGDDGTNDLVVSEVIRTNEMQVWFVAEHLVDPFEMRTGASLDGGRAHDFIA